MTREEATKVIRKMLAYTDLSVRANLTADMVDACHLAIKALEQEPSGDDVVSRDVVKEQMIMYGFHAPDMTVTEFVEDLPPVNPKEPRWIPVSEKLPDDRDWYLGIFKEPDTGWINPLPFICDYVGHETKATTKEYWILRGFTDRDYKECDYYYNLECVAWMPLPQNYGR